MSDDDDTTVIRGSKKVTGRLVAVLTKPLPSVKGWHLAMVLAFGLVLGIGLGLVLG